MKRRSLRQSLMIWVLDLGAECGNCELDIRASLFAPKGSASFGGSFGEVPVAWRSIGAGVGTEFLEVNWTGKSLSTDSM